MSDTPIDKEALYDLVDEDPVFLESLVETFIEDCASYMDAIRSAIDKDDALTLREEAHGLKGAVANLQAAAAEEAAHRLEKVGREGEMAEADEVLEDLEHEIGRVRTALREMVEEA